MPWRARSCIRSRVMSLAVEQDPPAVAGHQADDHVEGRGLARAVGPEQPDDLAGAEAEVDAVDDVADP